MLNLCIYHKDVSFIIDKNITGRGTHVLSMSYPSLTYVLPKV